MASKEDLIEHVIEQLRIDYQRYGEPLPDWALRAHERLANKVTTSRLQQQQKRQTHQGRTPDNSAGHTITKDEAFFVSLTKKAEKVPTSNTFLIRNPARQLPPQPKGIIGGILYGALNAAAIEQEWVSSPQRVIIILQVQYGNKLGGNAEVAALMEYNKNRPNGGYDFKGAVLSYPEEQLYFDIPLLDLEYSVVRGAVYGVS